jgi:hypothetical protein
VQAFIFVGWFGWHNLVWLAVLTRNYEVFIPKGLSTNYLRLRSFCKHQGEDKKTSLRSRCQTNRNWAD